MVTKTKWEKEELLKVLNENRIGLRCDLQRKLKIERNDLTKNIDIQIKELEHTKLNILKKYNLLNLEGSRYGCNTIPLHPKLKVFDKNTNIERKKILEG
jgi:hypothetical protein